MAPGLTGSAQYSGTGGVAATAQDDLDIAYANAAGQAITATLPVDLSLSGTPATPLLPGVYETTSHGALQINTGLTLDFGGDATGVSLGASSAFKGTTMALGASVLGNSATVDGRILTRRSKAVTLDANTITRSGCSTATDGGGGSTTTPEVDGDTTPAAGAGSPSATPPRTDGTPTPVRTLPVHLVALTPPAVAPVRGSAKLTGPRAPVRNPFAVWVTGRAIDRVVFSVDGKRIGTVRAKRGRTKFKITITPRRGRSARVHRLTARITFKRASGTSTVVRRTTYYTADDTSTRVPRFAG